MLKSLLLACAFALVAAQTTTDGPEMETVVVTTFQGDCESLFADPVASAALIGEIGAQIGAGFGVTADMVVTTLGCGSIIGTSTVSGGVTPTAPLVVTSTDFGAAVVAIDGGGGGPVGSGSRYGGGGEAGKAGKGMGKGMGGGEKGMGGEGGSKGGSKGMGGEQGSGKGQGEMGGKGKGSFGSLNAAAASSINRNSAAAISAGIVLVAGLGLITVRRLRNTQGYEMVTHDDMEYVAADEKTELLRVETQA